LEINFIPFVERSHQLKIEIDVPGRDKCGIVSQHPEAE
jgi:hypothetical protein